ncbi:hypothetical protein KUV47_08130 [Vannielia litorea]|uniref:thermonuclease family protein n=1 Tax=Vannielia litorea TaxID=1217970 RepID=UPI001C974EE5|nr:hypothetical protein [Vannielia litorea]MBY6153174.1 hypothetical protein [Vannielia litorea]
MRFTLIASFIAALSNPAKAEEVFDGPYFGTVLRVIDGDTFEAEVSIWPTIKAIVSVRLRGIDAPELHRPECEQEGNLALRAKSLLEQEIPTGTLIRLEDVKADSFFPRVVATAFRQNEVRGTPVDTQMLRTNYVAAWVPGDEAIDWCSEEWRLPF